MTDPQSAEQAPRLLDLYCCEGGAAMGYHRAGFDVTGVDVVDRADRYPFKFHQADALEFLAEHAHEYDAVHASPPCQGYTTMSNRWRGDGGAADQWSRDIAPVRDALNASGLPWVIENVGGARSAMYGSVTLHGGMFGLGVHRPRLFETSWAMPPHPPRPAPTNPVGVYGKAPDGRRLFTRKDGSEQRAAASCEEASAALGGCDWMSWDGLRECIPPAFSEYVGHELLAVLEPRTRAGAES